MSVAILSMGCYSRVMNADDAAEVFKLLAQSSSVQQSEIGVYTEDDEAVSPQISVAIVANNNFVSLKEQVEQTRQAAFQVQNAKSEEGTDA